MGKIHRINAKKKFCADDGHPFISDAYVCNA